MNKERFIKIIDKYTVTISVIIGIAIALGLKLVFISNTNYLGYNSEPNNIMYIIITIGISSLIFYNTRIKDRRLWIVSIIIGIIFSITYYLGEIQNEYIYTTITLSKKFILYTIIKLLTFWLLFTNCIVWMFNKIPLLLKRFKTKKEYKYFTANKKSIFVIALVFFISYLPFFMYYYPGNINTDNMGSFYQITGMKPYSNFQPILYTLIFGGLWNLGKLIFGTSTAGVAVYTVFQMLCTSMVFSIILYYMAKRKIDLKWRIITFLFLLLNPMNGWFAVRAEKGMLFHLTFILVVLGIIDIVKNKEEFFEKKWKPICFIIATILMIFIRNNGIYGFILAIPFLILACKQILKKILVLCMTILITILAVQGPIYRIFNINYSNPAEALSIPMQQFARISKYAGDRISEEDKKTIEKYFKVTSEELAENYTPWFADTVKWVFDSEEFKNDKLTFILQYMKFYFKFPVQSTLSIIFNTGNNYCPNFNVWGIVRNFGNETQEIYATVGAGDKEYFEKFMSTYPIEHQKIINFSYLDTLNKELIKIPLFSDLLSNIGLYFWMLVLCFAYCIYTKKYENIVMLLPVIGLWITTVAAPMVDLRYIYPMFLTIPLYIGIIVKDYKKE